MPETTITIMGCGLVGGSIALALRRRKANCAILGIDRKDRLPLLKRSDAWDQLGTFQQNAADFVGRSKLVILATPVDVIFDQMEQLARLLKPGTVVTDVGSTKAQIMLHAQRVMPENVFFVGGHPIAGSERSGFEAADPLLFKDHTYVLCPQPDTPKEAMLMLLNLVEELLALPVTLEGEEHDKMLATVSHVPQLLAIAVMDASLKADASHHLLTLMVGQGFLDMTRLACSDYSVWRSILDTNHEAIESALDRLEQSLSETRKAMQTGKLSHLWHIVGQKRRLLRPDGINLSRKEDLRELIDHHDESILKALYDRFQIVRQIGRQKKDQKAQVVDSDRERRLLQQRKEWARSLDLPGELIDDLFQVIMKHSKQMQLSKS